MTLVRKQMPFSWSRELVVRSVGLCKKRTIVMCFKSSPLSEQRAKHTSFEEVHTCYWGEMAACGIFPIKVCMVLWMLQSVLISM